MGFSKLSWDHCKTFQTVISPLPRTATELIVLLGQLQTSIRATYLWRGEGWSYSSQG